uniref:Putative secreted protein n=1 Tax=Anopheles darlingi TaxID=43151 RepID=A0A2M4DFP8_ANODA
MKRDFGLVEAAAATAAAASSLVCCSTTTTTTTTTAGFWCGTSSLRRALPFGVSVYPRPPHAAGGLSGAPLNACVMPSSH